MASEPTPATPQRRLPRHVIGAISAALGFVGGIATLLVLPKLGVPPKVAGAIGMVVWLASTWPFWWFGEKGKN
jgi:hypothetical protein